MVRTRPFWISPRQVVIIPVAAPHKEYATKIQQALWDAGFYADVDLSDNTLPKKIRSGEIAQYNFIFGPFQRNRLPSSARLTPRAHSRRKRGGRH